MVYFVVDTEHSSGSKESGSLRRTQPFRTGGLWTFWARTRRPKARSGQTDQSLSSAFQLNLGPEPFHAQRASLKPSSTMQCTASTSILPALRTSTARLAVRAASTSSRAKGKGKSGGVRSKRLPAAPAPNALTFDEAIRTLRALSPGDKSSAYELTLLSRLAGSVNINSLRGRSFLAYDASSPKKKEVILVFAEGEKAEEARREGADIVGGKELVDEVRLNRSSARHGCRARSTGSCRCFRTLDRGRECC